MQKMKVMACTCLLAMLFACSEDETKVTLINNQKTDGSFNYVLTCSEDLLKFITPVAIYHDEKNIEHVDTLNEDVWMKSDSISIDGKLSIKGEEAFRWRKKISFSHFNVSSSMTVKYIKKENVNYSENDSYRFYHNLICPVVGYTNNLDTITFSEGTPIKGSQVADYLQSLSRMSDSRNVAIDADGKINRW